MNKKEQKFIETVWEYFKRNGRHTLPWRKTRLPYRILISEIMLQQTQVDRVVPKYKAFLTRFPTVQSLAQAPLGDVLKQWQGLGYNRRAKMLHECVKSIVEDYKGKFPKTTDELVKLPGVGPYTASAIATFAFGEAVPLIETNVRSVYLHHFFKDGTQVSDTELFPIIERTLPKENPREWYYALMDYGSHLKKEFKNPSRNSLHHTQQSVFNGSDRQIRGAVIRALTENAYTRAELLKKLSSFEDIRIDAQIQKLSKEGMLVIKKGKLMLP